MSATATQEQISAVCKRCGQSFFYEPIYGVNNVDFGNVFGICQDCEAAREKAAAAQQHAIRQAEIDAAIIDIIPEDLRATDPRHPEFDPYGTTLWRSIRKWRPNPENLTLLIHGSAARCKTRCMALLAMSAMRAGVRVAWTTSIKLKQAAADRNMREPEIYRPARMHLDSILTSGWLFIDDLGKQGDWTQTFESVLFETLDYRITHRLATVISSNSAPDEFHLAISSANAGPIISRLNDRATIINMGR